MSAPSRWLTSLILAAGLGAAALVPAPARAGDDLVRILVDVADVVLRGSTPYYRHGSYGRHDRLIAVRDRYGRVTYYREVPRHHRRVVYHPPRHRPGPPPHARAWGHPSRNSYHVRYDRDHRGKRHDRDRRDRDRRHRDRRGRGW
ncbi:hypothetical protein ACOPJQ_02195 [Luteimonas dalianensis]|uniref:hypothetical protein n=1 Tax=Luteimonas dalianensis TaxID=1148196 RepID=UPI003BF2A95A